MRPGRSESRLSPRLIVLAVIVAALAVIAAVFLPPYLEWRRETSAVEELRRLDWDFNTDDHDAPLGLAFLGFLADRQVTAVAPRETMTDTEISLARNIPGLALCVESCADALFPRVAQLPNVASLWVNRANVSSSGVASLKGLSNLVALQFPSSNVGDDHLEHIGELTGLRYLGLAGSQVTDTGLGRLTRLSELRILDLTSTKITDSGLAHIKALTSLSDLLIRNTQATEAGLSDLQRALPGCDVAY
ncbi:MAG: hypothetical protein ACYSU0_13430 [Planctomycetota bacterium]|jgi:hypothetical protein